MPNKCKWCEMDPWKCGTRMTPKCSLIQIARLKARIEKTRGG